MRPQVPAPAKAVSSAHQHISEGPPPQASSLTPAKVVRSANRHISEGSEAKFQAPCRAFFNLRALSTPPLRSLSTLQRFQSLLFLFSSVHMKNHQNLQGDTLRRRMKFTIFSLSFSQLS
jgi:hypothetical protein